MKGLSISSSKRSIVRPCRRSLAPCRASPAASVSVLKEAKDRLREQLKGMSAELFAAPKDMQEKLASLTESLESGNPTSEPRNAPDKFAGSWLLRYTSCTIPEDKRSELGDLKLSRVYYSIDLEQQELTKNLEFEASRETIPGCLNMSSTFEWASGSKLQLSPKNVSVSSDELKEQLKGKQDMVVDLYGFKGSFNVTFEDDGLLMGRDEDNNLYVLEHRITRVHA